EERGPHLVDHGLDARHDGGSLLGMGAGADGEESVGVADSELVEEDVAHALVVVLTGVDEHRAHVAALERVEHRLDLHEVRARSSDGQDLGHGLVILADGRGRVTSAGQGRSTLGASGSQALASRTWRLWATIVSASKASWLTSRTAASAA